MITIKVAPTPTGFVARHSGTVGRRRYEAEAATRAEAVQALKVELANAGYQGLVQAPGLPLQDLPRSLVTNPPRD